MLELKASNIYRNRVSFISARWASMKFFSTVSLFTLIASIFFTFSSVLGSFQNERAITEAVLLNAVKVGIAAGLCLYILSILISVGIALVIWESNFSFYEGRIDYKLFFISQSFSVENISKILLTSKNSAIILCKGKDKSFVHSLYWYGNSEDQWIDFLNALRVYDSSIADKVFICRVKGIKYINIKSSVECSYREILSATKS